MSSLVLSPGSPDWPLCDNSFIMIAAQRNSVRTDLRKPRCHLYNVLKMADRTQRTFSEEGTLILVAFPIYLHVVSRCLTLHFWNSNGILWRVLEINENNWEQWAHNVSEVLGFPESCRQRAWGQTLESSVYDQGWQGVWSLFTLHGMVESPNQEGRRACLTFSTLVLAWAQSYLTGQCKNSLSRATSP